MRTFYIALTIFVLLVAWLLNKPIPKQASVVRAFNSAEIEYLEKSFDHAMDNLKPGEFLDWSAAGVNGRISAGDEYHSQRKAQCRPYIEVSRTYQAQKVESAVACKRAGKEGWCRIYGDNPQSCALEKPESVLVKQARFSILQGEQVIDAATAAAMGLDPSAMMPEMPSVNAPEMPGVGMPGLPGIDIEPGDLRPPMPWDKN
jgi:hypothetical protein